MQHLYSLFGLCKFISLLLPSMTIAKKTQRLFVKYSSMRLKSAELRPHRARSALKMSLVLRPHTSNAKLGLARTSALADANQTWPISLPACSPLSLRLRTPVVLIDPRGMERSEPCGCKKRPPKWRSFFGRDLKGFVWD